MNNGAYDLVVVGAGPGGYVAAIHAAQGGLKTAIIEARELGGLCLQAGCIPTKAMLASVDSLRHARAAAELGVELALKEGLLGAINARQQRVVKQLTQGVQFLLTQNKVEIIRGHGFLKSSTEVEVQGPKGEILRSIQNPRAILLATGSHPIRLAQAPADGISILNSHDMLRLPEIPRELVIIGGGYIGCEFASMFAPLGTQVTIVEGLSRLLPNMDKDLGAALARSFQKIGIKILLDSKVASAKPDAGAVKVELSNGQVLTATKALVAVGRSARLENLGLENAGIQSTAQGILINDFCQTNVPHIYAIGDVTGKLALAHVASAQGRRVVEHLLAQSPGHAPITSPPLNYEAVPACVFTHPEIASVGLTEELAAQRGLAVRTARFPFAAIGKAQASGEIEGFIKLVADSQSGRLLGGHIIGAHAAELIATLGLAVQLEATIAQITATIFAHPTLSEAIHEAAEGVFGQSTHIVTRK